MKKSAKRSRFVFLWIFGLPTLFASASGQVCSNASPSLVHPGVVIERVDKNSEADRAGLQPGDLLLCWSRGEDRGSLGSPFDLKLLEIDQGPRGRVTLEGRRGGQEQHWTLGPNKWGLHVRPTLAEPLLSVYREGAQLAKSGKVDEAAECWRKAAAQARESHIPQSVWLESWFLLQAAVSLAENKEWKQADETYQDAVQRAQGSDPWIAALVLDRWVDGLFQRNGWDEAEKRLQQAIAISEKTRFETLTAYLLTDLGFVMERQRDDSPDLAEGYFRRAAEIQERFIPDSLQFARSLNNLGMKAYLRNDLAKAEEYHSRSLAIQEKLDPGSLGVADCLNNLGNVAEARRNLTQAEQYHRRALTIREKIAPGSLGMAYSLANLGILALDRADFTKAEEYEERAHVIIQKVAPESIDHITVLSNLCEMAVASNDLRKAEEYCRQAQEILDKHAAEGLAATTNLKNLGQIALLRGDLDKAGRYYHQALAIWEKLAPNSALLATITSGLGDVAMRSGDLDKAEGLYRRAIAIQEKTAPESAEQAQYLANLAGVLRKHEQLDTASQTYAQALNALESQMARLGGAENVRAGFRAQNASIYRDYIDLLMSRGQHELALQILERARARTLLETLTQAHIDIHKGADPELLQQERSLQELLHAKSELRVRFLEAQHPEEEAADLEKEIAGLRERLQDVESQLRVNSPAYSALTQPQPLSVNEIQNLLDDDSLMLDYSLGEEHSHLWAVTRQSIRAFELPREVEIESAARQVYDLLTVRTRLTGREGWAEWQVRWAKAKAAYPQAAAALSRMVLGPVAGDLERRRLLIVGDGALQYIPFAALPEPAVSPARQQRPLMADHEILALPSASVLATLRRQNEGRQPAPRAVAVIADPVFEADDPRVVNRKQPKIANKRALASGEEGISFNRDLLSRSLSDLNGGGGLPRLLFSREEAELILSVAPKKERLGALDFRASRATALNPELGKYRIVHFATHGLLDSEHPELSGLVLSLVDRRGSPIDGFLSLQDVYNMDLHAGLVVLSACQTALGKQVTGEGILGLTRGFMNAGATDVLASLWSVSDAATAKLMWRFYTEIERNGLRPAAALRRAQIWMWNQQKWSFPFYWAAFQIQGDWK